MSESKWAEFRPMEPSDANCAFGLTASELKRFAPMYLGYHRNECPTEFQDGHTLWNAVVSQWFYGGLKPTDVFEPKDGIDRRVALHHVSAIMQSFEPDHNSKEAVCAFLLSLWFDDFTPSAEHSDAFRTRCRSARGIAA